MYSRMDKYHGQKIQRFSIRKYSFGAASVAVAAYMMFGGAATVHADVKPSTTTTNEQVKPDAGKPSDSTTPLVSNETATPTAEQPSTPATATPAHEGEQPSAPSATPKAAEVTVTKADTSKLEAAIARMEAALEKAGLTEKTASAIEAAKAELANAKAVVANEAATKEEVAKATSAVNGKAFVIESMPKATADKKEEKENKNQDPRNGQAIPGQGESGFRAVDTTAANSAEEAAKYKAERDNALTELQANIAKIQAKLDEQKAKDANKKDQAVIDTYTKVIEKANGVVTKANAANATSAQAMSQQAEAVKSERDLLAFYLAGKTELGAPVSENHVAYGNNPKNGVFESLKEGFGDRVTFTDADKKSETIAKQYESGRDITNRKDSIGSATYNWQEKAITKAEAEALLNGWKIEKGEKVNAVKPLPVTNVTDKDGNTSTREVPKSKVYSNDGELIQYQRFGHEKSYNSGSGVVPTMTPTIDAMRSNIFGEVKNRDYYLELGSKGTTLSKEFDVNGNSRLNVNLIHSAAYGGSTATSAGEKVKLTIVDAFTGEEIKPVEGKNGPLATEQGALAGNGWNHLDRIYDIPATTTKIKVLIEAGSQGDGLTANPFNPQGAEIKDGYLVGGIGIATAPAAEVLTNVRSENKSFEFGYTKDTIYDKGQKGVFDIDIKNTGGMNIDYYAASNVEVTVEVPKGVVLEDKIYNANGGSNWLGNVWANTIKWVPNDPSDNSKGGKLTYNVPAGNRMAAAEKNSRKTSIPFTAADNFVGPADFKVTVKSGFGDTDAEGNRLYSYTANGLKPAYENEFNRNGLANSDDPNHKYGREIFINSLQTNSVITVPINTTDEQLKAIAYAKAQEAIKTPEFTKLLSDVKGTAALGDSTKSEIVDHDDDDLAITKVAEDGRGIVKVPVTYTVDGKTYETTVDIEVNVVESKTKPVVVFEGDEITPASVKEKVEPSEIDGKKGTPNEPKSSDIFKTAGKAGESGLKIPTTVTHNVGGTEVTEDVTVPVTVLPRTEGEVDVPNGTTPDKVKDTLKAKAEELIKTPDFPSKVPDGYTVTVGEIPELPADIANKKGEPVVVKVPVTFTSPDGTTYTSEIPVTVNVKGSEVKPVYVVEGKQPKPADVNEAVTPDKGGDLTPVTEADINKDVPTDKVKVGATDLSVKATVKYPTGDETVDVPVKVLPKATPTGVTVLKDTDDTALTNAVKEKANEALSKLTNLPDGITASLDERETSYTLPKTDSNGDKDTVPVKVLYKDAKGNVVGEDTINVPVKVVSSTPKSVVVFEGKTPEKDKVKESVTPGEGGTVGEPTTVPSTKDKAGATDVSVDVPVTYDNGKVTETVKVPVTVLPVAKGDVTVVKNTTPDKLKELAKDKAKEAVEATDFKSKLPTGAKVTVGDVTEEVLAKLTEKKGTNTGTVNVPVTYTVDGKNYETTIPVTVNVKGSDVKPVYVVEGDKPKAEDVNKAITPDTDGTKTPVTDEEINKAVPTTEGKVGSPDVKVTTKVTYPNNVEEPITVPVTVLPKVKPEGVTVPKDADKTELAKVVKEKAEEAAKKLTGLPNGVKVTVTEVKTTPGTDKTGEQTPATVTVKYTDKDGNEITKVIEVPVNVVSSTPPAVVVFEGDTPNSEDIKKGITPGEGGTVGDPTKVPSTVGKAGDKDVEVEVPVTYGNGKFKENVKVPVTVLPKPKAGEVVVPKDLSEKELKDKVGKDAENAINNDEFKKKLPEGATVKVDLTNVTLPKTSTPGKAGEVEVPVVYTVNGKEYKTTVKVPVTVVEGKEQLVPKGDKPDPKDNITPGNYPEGATFEYDTPVDTSKPGKKEAVVIVKDKDGKEIVRVPVVVNVVEPKVTPIVVPQGTTITPDDVKKHVDIPKESGWEIIEVGEIPTTETPGDKTAVKVKVKLPTGEVIELEVPVKVTPKESTDLIPAPVQPDQVVTYYVDENGKAISPSENGAQSPKAVSGYEYQTTTKDPNGNLVHHYKKVATPQPAGPTAPEQPAAPTAPAEPGQPATPNQTQPAAPAQADATVATDTTAKPATPKYVEGQKELPNTGTEAHAGLAALGLLGALSGFGLLSRKKKED